MGHAQHSLTQCLFIGEINPRFMRLCRCAVSVASTILHSVVLSRIQQYTIWIDRRDKVLRTRSEDVSRTTGLERVPLPVVAYRMLGILIQTERNVQNASISRFLLYS